LEKLRGSDIEIFKERDRKLEVAREKGRLKRQRAYSEGTLSGEAFVF